MTFCNALQTEVIKSHGCICLTGPTVERIAADALSFLQLPHNSVPASRRTLLGNIGTSVIGTAAGFPASCSWSEEQLNCHKRSAVTLQQAELEPGTCLPHFRPHVTLVTKEELAACTVSRPQLLQDFQLLDRTAFFAVGLATADTTDMLHTCAATSPDSLTEEAHTQNSPARDQQSQTQPGASQMETQSNLQRNAQTQASVGKTTFSSQMNYRPLCHWAACMHSALIQ